EATADPGVLMIQVGVNGAPFRAEFPENTRSEEVQGIAAILAFSATSMDVLEPFTRLEKALNFLATGRS
ncbi:MAG: hypothetical protein IJ597_07910, partial [Synergistaceae bacterium]|nr:hypothetical protein [Synergistaceae bacterium]